jgi:F-type H+-transporting ATPase subunit delta
MAARNVAGRRYALAMIDIARADGDADAWLDAVEVLDALTAQRRYVEVLQSDGMTDEQLQSIIRRALPNVGTKQLNLFRLLRRKNRLALGPSIASFFRELLDEERGIVRATVTSAITLDDARVAAIRDQLASQTGKTVELETAVDEALIGGLVIRVGDQLLDGSTRGRLRALRSHLERAAL